MPNVSYNIVYWLLSLLKYSLLAPYEVLNKVIILNFKGF